MPTPTRPETAITSTANHIASALAAGVDPDLQTDIDAWCELHGLDRLDDPREIVARQAAFNTLLKSTLYERYHQQGRLPELPDDPRAAFETARTETGDPAFADYVLDRVAGVVDADALAELLDARHELLAAD